MCTNESSTNAQLPTTTTTLSIYKTTIQTIIPYKTSTYSEIKDPEEDAIPMCTIRDFPSKIEHCIEYALGIFDTLFNINKPNETQDITLQYINLLYYSESLDNLVQFGIYIYLEFYKRKIQELLSTHEDDNFWRGDKLKPKIFKLKDIITTKYLQSLNN